ncbi:DUF4287 domain-containing protein [Georgenia sp. MJ170]|uniref:DUF4287 domain-containing protein n=1 Tax=Georgenia sunbinii TaxID=3117728 RepID=UPI002F264EB1
MTRRTEDLVGDDTVVDRTGRPRQEWFALLDGAGATGWDHKRIAAWLVEEHDVDGWWAQGLTVGYEQARGMREPGQRPDGTFEASASKTVGRSVDDLFPHLADIDLRQAWLTGPWQQTGVTAGKTVRLAGDDGTRVLLSVTAAGEGRVRVTATHSRLPDADARDRAKTFWRDAVGKLATLLSR